MICAQQALDREVEGEHISGWKYGRCEYRSQRV